MAKVEDATILKPLYREVPVEWLFSCSRARGWDDQAWQS
jgi:hypothetical protein